MFAAGCGVTLALPLSNGSEDVGVGGRTSVDGGGCGDAGDVDGSRCGRGPSATLPDGAGDLGSGGPDSLEGCE
jgi:hypothetical protein